MLFKAFAHLERQKRSLFSLFVVVFSSLLAVVFFQNCGKAGFDAANDGASTIYNPASAAPFAFEASLDMITYNSCNSPSSQGKTFTFKVGSYESAVSKILSSSGEISDKVPKSGVRITQEFVSYFKKTLKPDYPNPDITKEQVERLLGESSMNADVRPQISIRSINKGNRLGNVFFKTGSPSIGIDIIQVLGDLTDLRWAESLIAEAMKAEQSVDFVNFFPKATGDSRAIEAEFSINNSPQTSEAYRNAFNKIGDIDAQIVIGFSHTNEAVLISQETSETDMMTSANARGYQLIFQNPIDMGKVPSTWAYHPNNQLAQVTEVDLLNNRVVSGSDWDCGLKFKIVRSEDAAFLWSSLDAAVNLAVSTDSGIIEANKPVVASATKVNLANYYKYYNSAGNALNINNSGAVIDGSIIKAGLCPKMEYATLNSIPPVESVYGGGAYAGKTYAQILEMVRRHLPDNEWDINLQYGCVVPKKYSCYPDEDRKAVDGGTHFGKYKVTYQGNLACHHKFDGSYYKANKTDAAGNMPTDYCTEYVTVCTKR